MKVRISEVEMNDYTAINHVLFRIVCVSNKYGRYPVMSPISRYVTDFWVSGI